MQGESPAKGLTEQLVSLGFDSGRMKTGTPPRVDGRSLDFSKMIIQPGNSNPQKFSYLPSSTVLKDQRSCHMTYTSPEVHDLLRSGFDRSPMFNGRIKSLGPRYCPSIEDKINRFADKDRHQIFVSQKVGIQLSIMLMVFQRLYLRMFSLKHYVQLQDLKTLNF